MTRIRLFLLFLLSFVSLSTATIPTFCKCTCFTNSTIIELGPHRDAPSGPSADPPRLSLLGKRAASASCDQCNRDFCLKKYNLPICRDAEDKDVTTQCFQRDSVKDRFIVWGFILGTAGLLGWAGLQKMLEMREGGRQQRGSAAAAPVGRAAGYSAGR